MDPLTPISTYAPHFDLRHTLESGQFFRWTREGDDYTVLRGLRMFQVRQEESRLRSSGADSWFLQEFLSLDHDLPEIERRLRRDRKLWEALDFAPGLRILRQDPWECTAAFILSIASNIPRITRNISDLAETYGQALRLGNVQANAFPRPGEIDDEAGMRRLKLGFRAKYLVQAERLARAGLLEEIGHLETEEARDALMVIPGVAEKVADCILLFAYGRLNAFPVDTWIRRVMRERFFRGRRVPDRAIRAFASERWGDLAGYAQQYLYHWSRHQARRARRTASGSIA